MDGSRSPEPGSLHEVQRLAAVLRAAAGELIAAPSWSLPVRDRVDVLVEVEAAVRAVEAARLAVVRSLEGQDLAQVGEGSVAAVLRSRCLAAPGRARADVAAARATCPDGAGDRSDGGRRDGSRGQLVGMGAALAAGQVSRAHLDVAVRVLDRVPARLRAAAAGTVDEFFVQVSVKYPPRACEDLAQELLDRLDPDRCQRGFDPDAFARRGLDLVVDSTGMVLVRGQLDALTGARLKAAVEHWAAPDPAVRDESGDPVGWDHRTAAQRRADALGIVADRALAGAGSRGGEPPRVVVHTSIEQLAALAAGRSAGEQTAFGRAWCEQTGFLTPDVLARVGCAGLFERVLTAPNGALLSLGRSARLASPAIRRALAARDKGCIVPGCGRRANQCDAHHVTSWVTGGLTNAAEMVLVCGVHHNAIHAGMYQVVMRDGIPWVRRPAFVDPDQTPVRNTLHHDTARARRLGRQILLDLGIDAAHHTGRNRRHDRPPETTDPPGADPPVPDSG